MPDMDMTPLNLTPLNPDRPKYRVSDGIREMIALAKKEPYRSINRNRGTSIDFFEYVLSGLGPFLERFEEEAGFEGASVWNGLRLHECAEGPLAGTVASHIAGSYYSGYNRRDDSASVLLENYGSWTEGGDAGPDPQSDGKGSTVYYYTYTMPRFGIIRPVHVDAEKYIRELRLPHWESEAMKQWNRVKALAERSFDKNSQEAKDPDEYIRNTDALFMRMKEVYTSFPQIMRAISSLYFEIESHMNDASLLQKLDKIIWLPPHESVVAVLRTLSTHTTEHKIPDDKLSGEKLKSKIVEYRDSIDLDELHGECIQSASEHVKTIRTVRNAYQSMAEKDFEMFDEYVNAFEESQGSAGLFQPLEFVDKHISERIGDG